MMQGRNKNCLLSGELIASLISDVWSWSFRTVGLIFTFETSGSEREQRMLAGDVTIVLAGFGLPSASGTFALVFSFALLIAP